MKNKYKIYFVNNNIGKLDEVLIEKHPDKHSGNLKGVTGNYLSVQIVSDRKDLFNTLQKVKLTEYKDGIIHGAFVE